MTSEGAAETLEPFRFGLLGEIAELFEVERPRRIASIRDALIRADATELRAAVHALKGTLSRFGPSPALAVVGDLERLAFRRPRRGRRPPREPRTRMRSPPRPREARAAAAS